MAYTKKTSDTGSTTNKSQTIKPKVDKSAEKIAALEAQIQQLQSLLMASMSNNIPNQGGPTNSLTEEVKIIHLVERAPGLTTHIVLSNLNIDMAGFGEERTLDRRQAEELAGKYRYLFEEGIIAFGEGSEDLAKRFALKSYSEYKNILNSNFVGQLSTLNVIELEELYKKLPSGLKAFIIEYFKRKIIEGDTRFKDAQKIEMLNRVSGCNAMSGATLDIRRDADRLSIKK